MKTSLSVLATIALIASTGCARAPRIAIPDGASPNDMFVAYMLNQPKTIELVGVGVTTRAVSVQDLSGTGPAGMAAKDRRIETLVLTGPNGVATLKYELKRRGQGPWRLAEWSVTPGSTEPLDTGTP